MTPSWSAQIKTRPRSELAGLAHLNADRPLLVIDLDQEGVRLQDVFMKCARMQPLSRGLDAHPNYLSLTASLRYNEELRKVKLVQLRSPRKETILACRRSVEDDVGDCGRPIFAVGETETLIKANAE
jgi:hypothetical protein